MTEIARDTRAAPATASRVQSIDILRGAVMIIMALDHVRDFTHTAAFVFSPTDLTRTTAALFFTRWITHFCAPVFMFTAGLGAFFKGQSVGQRELSSYLWKRGLWLMVLDWTAVHVALYFSFNYAFSVANVLWALGLSMVVLAALIRLPMPFVAVASAAVIALHNLADPIQAAQFGAAAPLWNIIHQLGAFRLGGATIILAYPLVPWVAVMALGYCCGVLFEGKADQRRRILIGLGVVLTIGFLVIRAINVYGDPARWTHQSSSLFTVLSFLNTTKYPPSLDFLLMTMGPALVILGLLDSARLSAGNPLIVLGRTPLFFFLVHLFLAHGLATAIAWARYGTAGLLMNPMPSLGGKPFPEGYGVSLVWIYLLWILVIALCYPLCRWFAGVKQQRKEWWLSYL